MKKTNTWLLRYSQPTHKIHDFRMFPSETTDVKSGTYPTLLKNRTIIERRADKQKGEEAMPIPMIHTVEIDGKRYSGIYLESPKGQFDNQKHFTPEEWSKLERDKSIIKLAQRHLQTAYFDANGKQLNQNFYVEDQPYYILTNIDESANQKAEHDQKIKKLGYEVSLAFQNEDKTEFIQLCYLMGINPTNVETGTLYNIIIKMIEEDPDRYDKIIENEDRWYKIVLNKALRTPRPNTNPEQNYIVEQITGQFTNYYLNDNHIATGYDALLGYFKDNPEMFEFLETNLDLKKKEEESTDSNSNHTVKSPLKRGRKPKTSQEVQQ